MKLHIALCIALFGSICSHKVFPSEKHISKTHDITNENIKIMRALATKMEEASAALRKTINADATALDATAIVDADLEEIAFAETDLEATISKTDLEATVLKASAFEASAKSINSLLDFFESNRPLAATPAPCKDSGLPDSLQKSE